MENGKTILNPQVRERIIREAIAHRVDLVQRTDQLAFCIGWLRERLSEMPPEKIEWIQEIVLDCLEMDWDRANRFLVWYLDTVVNKEEERRGQIERNLLQLAKLAGKDF